MEKEIEIARLVHYFIRGGLSDDGRNNLLACLQEDPGLWDYILMDAIIYNYGLRNNKSIYADM